MSLLPGWLDERGLVWPLQPTRHNAVGVGDVEHIFWT